MHTNGVDLAGSEGGADDDCFGGRGVRGFFLLAALWLVVTGDYDSPDDVDNGQPQERSNPTSASAW